MCLFTSELKNRLPSRLRPDIGFRTNGANPVFMPFLAGSACRRRCFSTHGNTAWGRPAKSYKNIKKAQNVRIQVRSHREVT